MGRNGTKKRRQQMRWHVVKLARLASISLALMSPAAAASPVGMRLSTNALGVQPNTQSAGPQILGRQRRNTNAGQGLESVEDTFKKPEAQSPAHGSRTPTKDQIGHRLIRQQTVDVLQTLPNTGKDTPTLQEKKEGSAGRMRSIAVDIDAVVGSCRMSDPSYDDGTSDNHRTVPHDFVPSLNRRAKETPASPLPPLPPQFVLSSLERGVYSGASMKGSSLTQSGTPNADKYAYDLSARPNSVGKLSHPLLPKDPSTDASKEEADSSHRSMQADPAYAALARGTYTGGTSALGEAQNSLDKLVTGPVNIADNSFVKASTKTTMRRIWSDTDNVGAYQRVLAYKKAARLATSAVSVASAPRIDTNHATRHNVQPHVPRLDTKNAETLRPNRPAPPATRRANASSECSKSDVELAAQLPHAGGALARSSEVLEDPAADSSADLLEKVRADLLEKAKATRATMWTSTMWTSTMWTSTTAVIPIQMHQQADEDEQERLHEQPSEWSNEEIEKWFQKHLRLQAMVRDSAIKTLRPAEQKTVLDTALAVVHESMHETEAFVHAVEKELEALGTSHSASMPNGEDLTEELADKDEQILKKHQPAQEDDQVHTEANDKIPSRKPSAVPAVMQPVETWGTQPMVSPHYARDRHVLAANGIFGVRLLAAIHEAGYKQGVQSKGAGDLLGHELTLLNDFFKTPNPSSESPTTPQWHKGKEQFKPAEDEFDGLRRRGRELELDFEKLQYFIKHSQPLPTAPPPAPLPPLTQHQPPSPPLPHTKQQRTRVISKFEEDQGAHNARLSKWREERKMELQELQEFEKEFEELKKGEFPLVLSAQSAQMIAHKAKSTLRAAGGAVIKLWKAAGKVLSEEGGVSRSIHDTAARPKNVDQERQDSDKKTEGEEPRRPQSNGLWRKFFSRFRATVTARVGTDETPQMSAEEEAFAKFFEQRCRESGDAECSQDAKTAYTVLHESRRQHVQFLEANLWGGLLAKRLEMAGRRPAEMATAVWAPGKWAGVFVQDAYTEMQMQLEISEVSGDGPCRGFINWANGHSVTAFEGDVRGNQLTFQEMRVVHDHSGGHFLPGTRYRLWKDGGDGPGMEGSWMHPDLMVWGYLNLNLVEQSLVRTNPHASAEADAWPEVNSVKAAQEAEPLGLASKARNEEVGSISAVPPITAVPISAVPPIGPASDIPAAIAARMPMPSGSYRPQEIDTAQSDPSDAIFRFACVLLMTGLLLHNRSKAAALRNFYCCARTKFESCTKLRAKKCGTKQSQDEKRSAAKQRSKRAATALTLNIEIPPEAFHAVGRSVLRNSCASPLSSPMNSSRPQSTRSMLSSSPASLNRAREVLLSSSEQASFFSCPQPMTSSVESDLQSSREEEQELSSMVELENLRKSVGKENFHLLEPCLMNSDSDWVVHEHEEPDLFQRAPAPVNDKKNEPEMQDINPVCRQVARIPRFSDTSCAATVRRESDQSECDRAISLGWLSVEDAWAATVSELPDSADL